MSENEPQSGISNFLGGTPGHTIVKLAVISLVVGIIMSALNFTPYEVWDAVKNFFVRIYEMGFDAFESVARYFIWGAMVVVPAFLLIRLLRFRR